MVEVGEVDNPKTIIKPIGEKMVKLIDRVQLGFEKKYGFRPSIIDTTNMIADAVNTKSIHII